MFEFTMDDDPCKSWRQFLAWKWEPYCENPDQGARVLKVRLRGDARIIPATEYQSKLIYNVYKKERVFPAKSIPPWA